MNKLIIRYLYTTVTDWSQKFFTLISNIFPFPLEEMDHCVMARHIMRIVIRDYQSHKHQYWHKQHCWAYEIDFYFQRNLYTKLLLTWFFNKKKKSTIKIFRIWRKIISRFIHRFTLNDFHIIWYLIRSDYLFTLELHCNRVINLEFVTKNCIKHVFDNSCFLYCIIVITRRFIVINCQWGTR